jgi:hypothetical protein
MRVRVCFKFVIYPREKRQITKILNPWEYKMNPVKKMGIPGIRWEFQEYNGNPWNTIGIPVIQWKFQEYSGNPGNTVGIPRIRWEFQEYLLPIYEYT